MFGVMLGEAMLIFGIIFWIGNGLGKNFKMLMEGGGPSNDGEESSREKAKAKEMNKPPLNNPNVGANENNVAGTQGAGFQSPSLPDMKGADYGTYSGVPDVSGVSNMANGISGGGAIGVAVAGLVNGIGAVVQGGNIANQTIAGKHVIKGPVIQGGGLIYNNKLSGSKSLVQRANNEITNNTRGKTLMNQGGPSRNAISSRRVNIAQNGLTHSYLSGPVNRVVAGRTEKLSSRAPLRVQRLFVRQFTANKGASKMFRDMADNRNSVGQLPLGYQNNQSQQSIVQPQVNANVINLRQIRAVTTTSVALKSQDTKTMVGIKNIFNNPENAELSDADKTRLFFIMQNVGANNNGKMNMKAMEANLRNTIKILPQIPNRDKIIVAMNAAKIDQDRQNIKMSNARAAVREKTNPENVKRNTLDQMLADQTSPFAINFNRSVEETLRSIGSVSEKKMAEYKQEAWENIQARDDIPLEQKEAEYEKFLDEKLAEETGVTKDDAIEITKQRILQSPENAQAILGDEGAKKLDDAVNKSNTEENKLVVQELIKQDLEEHAKYVKANPKAKKKSYYEIYKERRDKEMQANIMVAASQLYANKSREFDKQKYQQMMPEGNNTEQNQEQPQSTMPSQIFIARGAQDISSAGEV